MKKKIIKRKRLLQSFLSHHLVVLASYELLVMASLGVLVFISLSLATSHAVDSSAFYFRARQLLVQNWAGQWGAYTAALIFYWLGSSAYAVLTVGWALWVQLIRHKVASWQQALVSFFSLSTGFFMVAACLDSYFSVSTISGLLGDYVISWGVPATGMVGAGIVGGSLIWLGICILYELPVSLYLKHGLLKVAMHAARAFKQSVVSVGAAFKVAYIALEKYSFSLRQVFFSQGYQKPIPQVFNDQPVFLAPSQEQESLTLDQLVIPVVSKDEKVEEPDVVRVVATKKRTIAVAKHSVTLLPQAVIKAVVKKPAKESAEKKDPSYTLPDTKEFTVSEEYSSLKQKTLAEAQEKGKALQEKLAHFGIKGQLVGILPGPVITLFEYAPHIDSKISKIIALEDDLALALQAMSIRILAPIPGKNVVGFEISHQNRQPVSWSALANDETYTKTTQKLPLILGVDIAGRPAIEDLSTMPHLLIAGATGAGKSVAMHSLLTSLLCAKNPDELKLVLIDPKRLEFASYADIPHLLFPIVTQPRLAIKVLAWLVGEMERRYELMAKMGARNISDYRGEKGEKLPFIAVMIDELADLMMTAGKEVEHNLVRLAQMARASGIHLIVATQRPSVDVVTGLIKVNFPSRIAFRVSSKIDSRTIIDAGGAEKLLGRGDLLFMHPSQSHVRRLHGAFIAEDQIKAIVDHTKAQRAPDYISFDVVEKSAQAAQDSESDELYDEVKQFIKTLDEISISMLQRHYRIGFNRSARIIERLEMDGRLAPSVGAKPRKIIHD